jgi:hypothetical protein
MGRNKHKKHPHKDAERKKEATNKRRNADEKVLQLPLRHIFSSGWVQNCGIAFFLTCVSLVVAMWTRTQIKAAAIGFASVGTLLLWMVAFLVVRYSEPPPFAVAVETGLESENRNSGPFFARIPNGFICPVSALLFMRVVNLQDVPSTISEFKVQVQAGESWFGLRRQWLDLSLLDGDMPLLYMQGESVSSVTLMETPLQTALTTGPIGSHKTMRGWAIFDSAPGFDLVPRPLKYQITIKDTAGKSLVIFPAPPRAEENLFYEHGLHFQPYAGTKSFPVRHFFYPN